MFDLMVYAILLFGFPLGVLVGYRWRDRISRERRARHQADQERARSLTDRRDEFPSLCLSSPTAWVRRGKRNRRAIECGGQRGAAWA